MAVRSTAGWPTHSNDQSTPTAAIGPAGAPVAMRSRTAPAASVSAALMKSVAPNWRAKRLLAGDSVDGHDPCRVAQPQCLDDVESDASDAEDRRGLTGADLGPVEHGARPRQHSAARSGRPR